MERKNEALAQRLAQVITRRSYPLGWLVLGVLLGAVIIYVLRAFS